MAETGRAGEAPKPEEEISLIPAGLEYEDPFSMKTVWAALFVGVVMLPGAMYMGLVAGVGMDQAAEWVTVILFLEIARRTFTTLRAQEIYLIFAAAASLMWVSHAFGGGIHTFGGSFGLFVWEQYIIQHPLFRDLAPRIPDWVVPPYGSEAYALRTFFHSDWVKPIIIGLAVTFLQMINRYTLGYVLFRATADAERLPFPLAQISVGGMMALAESSSGKEGWRWRVFSIGAMIGVGWGLIYVVIPVLTSAISPQPILLVPIPWIDLTSAIHPFLPGAMVGISTHLGLVVGGMVIVCIAREIAYGQVIGSVIGGIVIPPILVLGGWLPEWKPGYSTIPTSFALHWNFWISFMAGVGLVFGWAGIYWLVKNMIKERRERRAAGQAGGFLRFPDPPPGRGDFSTAWCVGLWIASTLGLVAMVKWLVPGFAVWIVAVFGFVVTPLTSYVTARMVGMTGQQQGDPFPMLKEMTFIFSGYKGIALWFAPVPLYNWGWEARHFKELEMAHVKYMSLVKLVALTTFLVIVFSFLYWSLIWRLGPIPSASYPYAQAMWPLGAQNFYLWLSITDPDNPARAYFMTRVLNFRNIGLGIAISGGLWALTSRLKLPRLFFFTMIGSFAYWPHYAIPTFIGALIGMRMMKIYGEEKMKAYAPIIGAGFACGMGLIGMVAIAVTLMAKAVTPMPY